MIAGANRENVSGVTDFNCHTPQINLRSDKLRKKYVIKNQDVASISHRTHFFPKHGGIQTRTRIRVASVIHYPQKPTILNSNGIKNAQTLETSALDVGDWSTMHGIY